MNEMMSGIFIWALPVLLAITVHEAAHGYVARHFGDPTAEQAGRITLDPFRHIDIFGTILVPLSIYSISSMMGHPMTFGWAKPVPVNASRLRNPKGDMFWVALAGPLANLVMAFLWSVFFMLIAGKVSQFSPYIQMADAGIGINGLFFFLNLLPIPPLDGGRIVISLLPGHLSRKFARIEPWGFPILLLMMGLGILDNILLPLIQAFNQGLRMLVGH